MMRSRLRNQKREYNKQRNYLFLRKTKTTYYANLNEKDLTDNKEFWLTVKPLLSDRTKSFDKITLAEHGETHDKDGNIDDEVFNNDVKIAENS